MNTLAILALAITELNEREAEREILMRRKRIGDDDPPPPANDERWAAAMDWWTKHNTDSPRRSAQETAPVEPSVTGSWPTGKFTEAATKHWRAASACSDPASST